MALKAGYRGIRQTFVDFLTGKLLPEGLAGKLGGSQVDIDSSLAADSSTDKLGVAIPVVYVAKKTSESSAQGIIEVEFDLPTGITSANTAFCVEWLSDNTSSAISFTARATTVNDTTHKLIARIYNASTTATANYIVTVIGVKIPTT